MNHRDIIIKWSGKNVQEPGYNPECVAWVKQYCKERGYPIGSFGGSAINGWNTGSPFDDSWVKVNYKPGLYPSQGDIIFYSENRCKYGHVSVANSHCNKNLLRHTDQNGNGHYDKITPRFCDYKNVLGWYQKLGQK